MQRLVGQLTYQPTRFQLQQINQPLLNRLTY